MKGQASGQATAGVQAKDMPSLQPRSHHMPGACSHLPPLTPPPAPAAPTLSSALSSPTGSCSNSSRLRCTSRGNACRGGLGEVGGGQRPNGVQRASRQGCRSPRRHQRGSWAVPSAQMMTGQAALPACLPALLACPALPCPAQPSPAQPSPAQPSPIKSNPGPALPCPALPCPAQSNVDFTCISLATRSSLSARERPGGAPCRPCAGPRRCPCWPHPPAPRPSPSRSICRRVGPTPLR